MADNKTGKDAAGATFTYATDDIAGVDHPRVKSGWGADGAYNDTSAATPMPVDPGAVVLGAGEQVVGAALGKLVSVQPVFAVNTAVYAAGDVVGGEIALTNAMRVASGTGMLHSLTLVDTGNVKPEFKILLFNSNPGGTYADQSPPTLGTDAAKVIGEISVATADWTTYDAAVDFAVANLDGIGKLVAASGSRDLYAVFIAVGTPLFTATNQITPTFWFINN